MGKDQDCGGASRMPFALFNQEGCLLKMSPLLDQEDWTEFSSTLPRAGMMQSGMLYQQQPSAHRTYAKEFSLSRIAPTLKRDLEKANGLATLLPTPAARDYKDSSAPPSAWNRKSPGVPVQAAKLDGLDQKDRRGLHLNPNWCEWLMGFPIGHTDLNA
jgi:hypothetical protein